MTINRNKKGKRFELDVAHLLNSITSSPWFRVANSGGLANRRPDNMLGFQGDVFSNDERYKNIVVECKFWNKLSINDLFSTKSLLHLAIKQAENEAGSNPWMLFIKTNNKGTLLILPDFINTDYTEVTNILSKLGTTGLVLNFKGYSCWKLIRNK